MLIISALLAGLTILFIVSPLLWGARPAFESSDAIAAGRREELLRQRQEVLASIKDLDLEYEVGKLTREDYDRTRERLSREAVELYRQLDEEAGS